MRIAVLNVDNIRSNSAISDIEPLADPSPWLKNVEWERFFISKDISEIQLKGILQKNFDVILNLCDGAEGEDRPGIEIVKYLEKNNQAYTGASSDFYDPTREEMKNACKKHFINYPKSYTVKGISEINISEKIQYPLIVKHPNSYNSVGLTRKSVVYNFEELIAQVVIMLEKYKAAMVEEYIVGREFTALVVENPDDKFKPMVFEPAEIIFPEGETFKHFDLKWLSHVSMKYVTVADKNISEQIKKMSAEMFLAMNGSGYARCDLRMNQQNKLFMLEINPNCSIYFPKDNPSSADEILFSEPGGHQRFTGLIIKSAKNKQRNL